MKTTVCQLPDRRAFRKCGSLDHAFAQRSIPGARNALLSGRAISEGLTPFVAIISLTHHLGKAISLTQSEGVSSTGRKRLVDSRRGRLESASRSVRFVHRKHFLPEMAGFFERTWFSRGLAQFESEELAGAKVGFAICTELWAMDIARHYCKRGVHFLVTPRATGSESIDKWIAAGRTGAVIAGAFAVSSNRFSFERNFGGAGWIIAPDGEILGLTNEREPFVTVDCALAKANHAKSTYPRSALNLAK